MCVCVYVFMYDDVVCVSLDLVKFIKVYVCVCFNSFTATRPPKCVCVGSVCVWERDSKDNDNINNNNNNSSNSNNHTSNNGNKNNVDFWLLGPAFLRLMC